MTTLVLAMVRGPAGIEKQVRQVSSGDFRIGRAPNNDWVIEDPLNLVSKRHCIFRQDDIGWWVADVSRNGSFVARGAELLRLGPEPYRLSAGERLRLGRYEIAIDLEEDDASFRAMLPDGRHPARMSLPPDVPPLEPDRDWSFPQPPVDGMPTGAWARETPRQGDPFAALLEGAALGRDAVGGLDEHEALRRAGSALRMSVAELRQLRSALLGEPTRRSLAGADPAARPLLEAASERDALRVLIDPARTDIAADAAIAAAFAEIRHHHDRLVWAARRAMRTMFESLDPDEPERQMLPHWLDLLPGWRRARSAVLARRRYRRLRDGLEQSVDQMLARAYRDSSREIDVRWGRR